MIKKRHGISLLVMMGMVLFATSSLAFAADTTVSCLDHDVVIKGKDVQLNVDASTDTAVMVVTPQGEVLLIDGPQPGITDSFTGSKADVLEGTVSVNAGGRRLLSLSCGSMEGLLENDVRVDMINDIGVKVQLKPGEHVIKLTGGALAPATATADGELDGFPLDEGEELDTRGIENPRDNPVSPV